VGNIIDWKGCAGNSESHLFIERTHSETGWGKRGKQRGKGWGRKLPHGVNGAKNSRVG
jgi:hypothetical protein